MDAVQFRKMLEEETAKRFETDPVEVLAEKATTILKSLGVTVVTPYDIKKKSPRFATVSWGGFLKNCVVFRFCVGVRVAKTATADTLKDLNPVHKIAVDTLEKAGMEVVPIEWHDKTANVDIIIATEGDLTAWLTGPRNLL